MQESPWGFTWKQAGERCLNFGMAVVHEASFLVQVENQGKSTKNTYSQTHTLKLIWHIRSDIYIRTKKKKNIWGTRKRYV